jgi:hypothetical protein
VLLLSAMKATKGLEFCRAGHVATKYGNDKKRDGRAFMQPVCDDRLRPADKTSEEWSKLVRKLHWIGMEDEARRLELALSTVPADERGVSAEPSVTD